MSNNSFINTIGKITLASAGVASVACGAANVIFYLLSHKNGNVDFVFKETDTPSEKNQKITANRATDYEWLTSQPLEHYHIVSKDGLKLHASLLKADNPTNKYVLAIHGYRATGYKEFDSIARFYHEHGINVFMIDHRASGDSEGKYITYGAKESEDCIQWLSFMRKTFGEEIQILLHGCSMGSATVMLLCGKILPNNVIFAVSDCGYSTLKDQLYHNFKQFKMPSKLSYELYRIIAKRTAGFDPDDVTPVAAMERCKIPVIFVHGKDDTFVPFEMVYAVYDACKNPNKTLITVDNAEHVQSFQLSQEYKDTILEYIDKLM